MSDPEPRFRSSGLVRDLAEYIFRRTSTNPGFAETCASALVAAACGPNVIISDEKGDVLFNIFGIVVGGSSISNKTVAVDIVRQILKLLSEELEIDLVLPQKFTIEGMSKHLTTNKEGLIAGDEYTSMFKGAKGKSWLMDTMEFLSTLYDNYLPDYVSIARGLEKHEKGGLYVSFISATTFYICRLMKTDDFFVQGTGCRFLWDVDFTRDELPEDEAKAAMFFLDSKERDKREDELKVFVKRLAELRRAMNRVTDHAYAADFKYVLSLDMESLKLLGMFRVRTINKAIRIFKDDFLNPDSGYLARLTENAIKLAGIHCVGRIYEDYPFEAPEVTKEDVEWATQKVEHHFDMYLKLKEIRDTIHEDRANPSRMTDFQKVLRCIKKNGGFATITQIMQTTKWLKVDTIPTLESMVVSKMLDVKKLERPGSKRHNVFVKHNDKIPEIEKYTVATNEPLKLTCSKCGDEIKGIPEIRGNKAFCNYCIKHPYEGREPIER